MTWTCIDPMNHYLLAKFYLLAVGDQNERAVERMGEAAAGGGKKRKYCFGMFMLVYICTSYVHIFTHGNYW